MVSGTPDLIRLKEYENLPYALLGEEGTRRLKRATKTLKAPVFRFLLDHAQAQQYVGVITAGRYTVQILPKIHDDERVNLGYLLSLLSYARRLRIRPSDVAEFDQLGGSFLEVWIRYFAAELNRLLRRQYGYRYVEVEERAGFLRGKLLVERELAGTATLSARYACRYEVFTPDHLLNRVLKFCNGLLLRQTRVASTRRLLRENDLLLADVAQSAVRAEDVDRIHLDRLNRAYEPILELCRLLLKNSTLDLRAGRIAQLAFVFDMNLLFEEFVAEFVGRHSDRIRLGGYRLERVKKQQPLGKLFDKFGMKVDLVLTDDSDREILLDTKYKALDAQKDHEGLSQDDFYQMYAYGSAGEQPYNKIVLLYPTTDLVQQTFTHDSVKHDSMKLHVRQFDPRVVYNSKSGQPDEDAIVEELNNALSVLDS
jgi:5-methylcytosine-specific restriction enzyme subunit McrC